MDNEVFPVRGFQEMGCSISRAEVKMLKEEVEIRTEKERKRKDNISQVFS